MHACTTVPSSEEVCVIRLVYNARVLGERSFKNDHKVLPLTDDSNALRPVRFNLPASKAISWEAVILVEIERCVQ